MVHLKGPAAKRQRCAFLGGQRHTSLSRAGRAAVFSRVLHQRADANTTLDECRALYTKCDNKTLVITITTVHGSGKYNKWCPCFDPLTQSSARLVF